MGYARELSWSLTRSRLLKDCPRAAWFHYYVQGEKEYAKRAGVLKHLVTLPMAAGAAIDYVIARTLCAYRDNGEVLEGLAAVGVRMLRRQTAESLQVAEGIRLGGGWQPNRGLSLPPLHHHVYDYDLGIEYAVAMEERLARCLENFESGEVWRTLRDSDVGRWHPIPRIDDCPTPFFSTSGGLKVWANVDFAMMDGGEAIVLDWKSGRESEISKAGALTQLAIYSMWACGNFAVPPEKVKVQAVWLQGESSLNPQGFGRSELESVAHRVKEETATEKMLVDVDLNFEGKVRRLRAKMEDFPTQRSPKLCFECRYRELCSEGLKECGHA